METYLIMGSGYWATGANLEDAKKAFKELGGSLSKKHKTYYFDGINSHFFSVDSLGYVVFKGTEPKLLSGK